MSETLQESPKHVEQPAYTEIETHSELGKELGGIVEVDLKVRIPKKMLRALQTAIDQGFMTGPTVEAELNYKLLLGLALEIEANEEYTNDFARLVSDPCGLNFQYDWRADGALDGIVANKEVS
jgi:hypothetical protein